MLPSRASSHQHCHCPSEGVTNTWSVTQEEFCITGFLTRSKPSSSVLCFWIWAVLSLLASSPSLGEAPLSFAQPLEDKPALHWSSDRAPVGRSSTAKPAESQPQKVPSLVAVRAAVPGTAPCHQLHRTAAFWQIVQLNRPQTSCFETPRSWKMLALAL